MPRYTAMRVSISPGQESKLHKAIQHHKSVTIRFSKLLSEKSASKYSGILCLTSQQLKKVQNSSPGTVFSFPFSSAQMQKNIHHEGGFLGILASILAPILGGIIGGVAENAIGGSFPQQHSDLIFHKKLIQ